MVTRDHTHTDPAHTEHAGLSAGALEGTSHALLVTALVGGAALVLDRIWPWLAWGYVAMAVVFGIGLAALARFAQKAHEREVEDLRRRHRPE